MTHTHSIESLKTDADIARRVITLLDPTGELSDRISARREECPVPFTVVFPGPPDITPMLRVEGVPEQLSRILNSQFAKCCARIATHMGDNLKRTASFLSTEDLMVEEKAKKLFQTGLKVYAGGVQDAKNQVILQARTLLASSKPEEHQSRPSSKAFNSAYVPFFRYFFLVKPYPTKGEKEWLAKKAGMGFRQVHVWFQNHRNRLKKEGGEIKALPLDSQSRNTEWDRMIREMSDTLIGNLVIPEDQRVQPQELEQEEWEWVYDTSDDEGLPSWRPARQLGAIDVLDIPSTRHGFPVKHPLCSTNGPYHDSYRFSTDRSLWRRTRATKPARHSDISQAQLSLVFERLNTKYENKGKYLKKRQFTLDNLKPRRTTAPVPTKQSTWRSDFIAYPCKAPLPSLVRSVPRVSSASSHAHTSANTAEQGRMTSPALLSTVRSELRTSKPSPARSVLLAPSPAPEFAEPSPTSSITLAPSPSPSITEPSPARSVTLAPSPAPPTQYSSSRQARSSKRQRSFSPEPPRPSKRRRSPSPERSSHRVSRLAEHSYNRSHASPVPPQFRPSSTRKSSVDHVETHRRARARSQSREPRSRKISRRNEQCNYYRDDSRSPSRSPAPRRHRRSTTPSRHHQRKHSPSPERSSQRKSRRRNYSYESESESDERSIPVRREKRRRSVTPDDYPSETTPQVKRIRKEAPLPQRIPTSTPRYAVAAPIAPSSVGNAAIPAIHDRPSVQTVTEPTGHSGGHERHLSITSRTPSLESSDASSSRHVSNFTEPLFTPPSTTADLPLVRPQGTFELPSSHKEVHATQLPPEVVAFTDTLFDFGFGESDDSNLNSLNHLLLPQSDSLSDNNCLQHWSIPT